MRLPIRHSTWQQLRMLARLKTCLGRKLRLYPTRDTKDGSFLTELVRVGLVKVVGKPQEDPFLSAYALTPAGRFAAEVGEYECDRNHIALIQPKLAEVDR